MDTRHSLFPPTESLGTRLSRNLSREGIHLYLRDTFDCIQLLCFDVMLLPTVKIIRSQTMVYDTAQNRAVDMTLFPPMLHRPLIVACCRCNRSGCCQNCLCVKNGRPCQGCGWRTVSILTNLAPLSA